MAQSRATTPARGKTPVHGQTAAHVGPPGSATVARHDGTPGRATSQPGIVREETRHLTTEAFFPHGTNFARKKARVRKEPARFSPSKHDMPKKMTTTRSAAPKKKAAAKSPAMKKAAAAKSPTTKKAAVAKSPGVGRAAKKTLAKAKGKTGVGVQKRTPYVATAEIGARLSCPYGLTQIEEATGSMADGMNLWKTDPVKYARQIGPFGQQYDVFIEDFAKDLGAKKAPVAKKAAPAAKKAAAAAAAKKIPVKKVVGAKKAAASKATKKMPVRKVALPKKATAIAATKKTPVEKALRREQSPL